MSDTRFDVLGIGNAIVDVLAKTNEAFLIQEGLTKGSMRLIDEAEAERLYANMGPASEVSGGCAGNTVSGVASFGGRAAFIGRVKDDTLGKVFRHDINAFGVTYSTPPAPNGLATARSMILITPDGERTMNTFLGASTELTPAEIDADLIAASAITYLEGYLWDPPHAKDAFLKAAEIAHGAGRKVALTLSDSFCVDRFRDEFLKLIEDKTVDIVFANEAEAHALAQTADYETAQSFLKERTELAVITRGENGAEAMRNGEYALAPASKVNDIQDLTGAGDLFAAGFLFGLAKGYDLKVCLTLGNIAAAEVIAHVGARPQTSLKNLAEQAGLKLS